MSLQAHDHVSRRCSPECTHTSSTAPHLFMCTHRYTRIQYERMFSTSRIPGRECDEVRHWDSTQIRHIAVTCKVSQWNADTRTHQWID